MIDNYKNREVVCERNKDTINLLSERDKNEYIYDGTITVSSPTFSYDKNITERLTSRVEVDKYNLEKLLKSSYYRSGFDVDGVPITYFLNIEYGLIPTIRFSDNTMHIYCKDYRFFQYLISYFEIIGKDYEFFTDSIRIKLN